MTEVKPWEPVRGGFLGFDIWPWKSGRVTGQEECNMVAARLEPVLHVTLANSQRVIVRALSDERKAARAMRREAVS